MLHTLVVIGIGLSPFSYHEHILMNHTLVYLVFQVLRVYAISGRLWLFALLVGVLSIPTIITNVVRICLTSRQFSCHSYGDI